MKLIDAIDVNPKETIKKGEIAKKIPMDKLQPFCRDIPEFELSEFSGGTKFKNGDTIMARITPCLENGKTAMVNILHDNEVGFGSTEFIVFRAKEGITNPFYVYYLVCSPTVRDIAIKSMVGSSGRQRVQTDVVKNIELDLPDYDTQTKVASILKSLDDKIAINSAINDNLEQQAQLLFNEFFFERKQIPNTWKKGCLLDIANYLNGLAMQKFRPLGNEIGIPVLKIKELRQGICDNNSERCSSNIKNDYIINDGDVIFSWSGSLLVDFWCGGICGLNQHLFKVSSDKYDKWFYYSWTKHHLKKFTSLASDMATTMGHIKREELEKAEVLIPDKDDYNKIGTVLKPIYEAIILNRIENRKLSVLRDSLLPKLMSGEIDVSNIEI